MSPPEKEPKLVTQPGKGRAGWGVFSAVFIAVGGCIAGSLSGGTEAFELKQTNSSKCIPARASGLSNLEGLFLLVTQPVLELGTQFPCQT